MPRPCGPAPGPAARNHRPARCKHSRRTGHLSIWVVIVLASIVIAWTPGAIAQEEGDERHVLILVGEEPGHTSVHQRIPVAPINGSGTFPVSVPVGAQAHEVHDAKGRRVAWSETPPGILQVALINGTEHLVITSRGVPGPAEGQDLRFGAADPAGKVWIVIGVAPQLESDAFGLQSVSRQVLLEGPLPDDWPLPDEWDYVWNEGQDTTMPPVISTARELRGDIAPWALAAGLAVMLGVLTLWLVARIHKSADDPTRTKKQPMMKHLEELRRRLIIIAVVLAVATVFFFSFGFRWRTIAGLALPLPWPSLHGNAASQVFLWLSRQIVPSGVDVVVVAPFDAVVTLLLLSTALGVLVTFPVLFFHSYAFLAPGLYPHERRIVLAASPAVVVLFGAGAAFGLLFMAPLIVMVLYGFAASSGAIAFLTMSQLVGISALLALVFAIAFQLPLAMMLTARMGIVRAETYRRQWRWAVIIIAIVSAMVTDPTVVTQIIVAAVLLGLYGIGLLLAWAADRKRAAPHHQERGTETHGPATTRRT